jgi:molecular chaperone GrpE
MNPEYQNPPTVGPESNGATPNIADPEADALHKELAEQKHLNLRLAADLENFKRRSRQENETKAAAQKESFIRDLLPSIDNLERALASGATPGSLQLHQGVEMTLQQLRHLLRQHGIETEESIGQPFDPHRHEAIAQKRDLAQSDQTILEVLQRGYRRGEKVLRPAKVVVNVLSHSREARHDH